MGPLLELYGEYLFKTGASLNSFQHLITFAQRTFGDFKLYSKGCWELVTKWELTEPLVHRPPLPLRICEAMAGVALTWAWPRFALVLLLAFTGILRIGEVLAAVRADLVLPVDLLSNDYSKAFLRVPKPKTGRRGGGKQQHATVRDERLIRACTRVFCNLEREQKLFPFSPQTFRKRWNEILAALGVQRELLLTPGSVRGGGCVSAYQAGCSVQDLLWQMRIQNIGTLQHYIQEMAAESIIGQLSQRSRLSISAASSLLPHLLDQIAHC